MRFLRESLTLYFGDLSGFLALIFISATAVLMVGKRKLSKSTGRNVFFKRIHIIFASLGGGFLLIHADYFISAPLENWGILLGYIAAAAALFVWFSGFAFLERLSDSLLYHGSISLAAISLIVIHSVIFGFETITTEIILALVAAVLLLRASQHIAKILRLIL